MTIKEAERQKEKLVFGIIAVAAQNGVSKARLKREAFSSYATGNRRLEGRYDEITIGDIFNMARICRCTPAQFIAQAAENISKGKAGH